MKRSSLAAIAFSLTVAFASCKKDDPQPDPQPLPAPASSNYSPMTTGSYWVYDNYNVDTNNTAVYWNTDSLYVTGDTVVNNKTYHLVKGTNYGSNFQTRMLRDSSGCILNEVGMVLFSATNFTDTLNVQEYPGIGTIYYKMAQGPSVSVPAGIYATLDMKGDLYMDDPNYTYGIPRFAHNYYADNIGKVKSVNFYVYAPGTIETRLVRYHIAP
jgi:hypothetical protein